MKSSLAMLSLLVWSRSIHDTHLGLADTSDPIAHIGRPYPAQKGRLSSPGIGCPVLPSERFLAVVRLLLLVPLLALVTGFDRPENQSFHLTFAALRT